MLPRSLPVLIFAHLSLAVCCPDSKAGNECRLFFDDGIVTRVERVVIGQGAREALDPDPGQPGVLRDATHAAAVGTISGSADVQPVTSTEGIELTVDLQSGVTVVVDHPRNEKTRSIRTGDRVHFLVDCQGTMWVWPAISPP